VQAAESQYASRPLADKSMKKELDVFDFHGFNPGP
jgi:hypothetical protein